MTFAFLASFVAMKKKKKGKKEVFYPRTNQFLKKGCLTLSLSLSLSLFLTHTHAHTLSLSLLLFALLLFSPSGEREKESEVGVGLRAREREREREREFISFFRRKRRKFRISSILASSVYFLGLVQNDERSCGCVQMKVVFVDGRRTVHHGLRKITWHWYGSQSWCLIKIQSS